MNSFSRTKFFGALASLALAAFIFASPAPAQQPSPATGANSSSAADSSDPVLKAMHEELERSKAKLKMDNVPAPYYIEYRLSDIRQFDAEAAFGALRQSQLSHYRSIHVVVRVGDYKQDSYFGRGMGAVELAPLDDDVIAIRRQLWIATDQAYKMASEALAQKKPS